MVGEVPAATPAARVAAVVPPIAFPTTPPRLATTDWAPDEEDVIEPPAVIMEVVFIPLALEALKK
jgi:hypothetical protein